MRTDRLSLIVGYGIMFGVTVPYVGQWHDVTFVLMHLTMTIIMLSSTLVVMWHGSRVNLVGGVFFIRYAVTGLFGMARVFYLGSFTADEIVWCYSVVTVSAFLITMGHLCVYLPAPGNSPYRSENADSSSCTGEPHKGAYLTLVFASAVSWVVNVAAQGGIRSYLVASYGLRVASTPPYLLAVAMFIEFPLYYLTWGVVLSPEYGRARLMALLWVFWSIARFAIEGRSGFILLAALVPVSIMYLKNHTRARRVRRIVALAMVAATIGLVVSSAVRFGRSQESSSMPYASQAFIERIVTSSTFDACEHLIRVNAFYRNNRMNGLNIVTPFVSWIPRSLWPQKPVQLGRRIVIDIYGAPSDTSVSFPVHLLGDFCADFGMIGVLTLPFVVGMLLGVIDKRYHQRCNHTRFSGTEMAEYVAYAISCSSMCNSFSSGLMGTLYMVPFWLLWRRLSSSHHENTRVWPRHVRWPRTQSDGARHQDMI